MPAVRGAIAAASLLIFAAACGGAGQHPSAASDPAGSGPTVEVNSGSCATGERNGKPYGASCVFVLSDGRRFSCPQSFARSVPTAATLEHARACGRIAPVRFDARVRHVITAIASTRTCLGRLGYSTLGGPVLPGTIQPEASSPDGEVIVGNGAIGPYIAYYVDAGKAARLAPEVVANAARIHASVERHAAITILWLRPPTGRVRDAVYGCALS